MSDPHQITTIEEVIALVGEPKPATAAKVMPDLGGLEMDFIARSPLMLLASANAAGQTTVSPKGDAPGFVHIADPRTLVIPERPGNRLIIGYRNMLENPHVGLLFMIPKSRETLRVDGTVTLTRAPDLLEALAAQGKPAQLAIRVAIERCFFHCGKAFIRSELWQPERWGEPFAFSWGAWAKARYAIGDGDADAVNEEIASDEKNNLY